MIIAFLILLALYLGTFIATLREIAQLELRIIKLERNTKPEEED